MPTLSHSQNSARDKPAPSPSPVQARAKCVLQKVLFPAGNGCASLSLQDEGLLLPKQLNVPNPTKAWSPSVSRALPACGYFRLYVGLCFHAIVSSGCLQLPQLHTMSSLLLFPPHPVGWLWVSTGTSLISPDLRFTYISLHFLPLRLSLPFMQMVQISIKIIPLKLYFLTSK